MTTVRTAGPAGDHEAGRTTGARQGSARRFVREHSLALAAFGAFLVLWLGGQVWAGHRTFNEEQRAHGEPTVSLGRYLTEADFGEAAMVYAPKGD